MNVLKISIYIYNNRQITKVLLMMFLAVLAVALGELSRKRHFTQAFPIWTVRGKSSV